MPRTTTMEAAPPAYEAHTSVIRIENKRTSLRRHRSILYALIAYLILLILPWALLCVLTFMPLVKGASYTTNPYNDSPAAAVAAWSNALHAFLNVQAVLAVPAVSYFLARGAVVYVQRRGEVEHGEGAKAKEKGLTAQEMLVLADREWERVWAVTRGAGRKDKGHTKFLWFGALLVFLSAVTPLLRGALISTEEVMVSTCNHNIDDKPYKCGASFSSDALRMVGLDPEPADMALLPLQTAVHRVAESLASWDKNVDQPFLWDDDKMRKFVWYMRTRFQEETFVSAVPRNTTTGILRYHAMRLNSTVNCTTAWWELDAPPACVGGRPFQVNWTGRDDDGINYTFDLCAPGRFDGTVWNTTRDRVDVNETLTLYLRMQREGGQSGGPINKWARTHCVADTSRGYFELGNAYNNYVAGPLLSKWPDEATLKRDFHDRRRLRSSQVPTNNDDTPYPSLSDGLYPDMGTAIDYSVRDFKAPGPLVTTAIALFGNSSWFAEVGRRRNNSAEADQYLVSACRTANPFPMVREGFGSVFSTACRDVSRNLTGVVNTQPDTLRSDEFIIRWLRELFTITESTSRGNITFQNVEETRKPANMVMQAGVYLANVVALTETAGQFATSNSREIKSAPGAAVVKPWISIGGMAAISALVLLQAAMLIALVAYTWPRRVWTETLDGRACARLGAANTKRMRHGGQVGVGGDQDTGAALAGATVVFAATEEWEAAQDGTELADMDTVVTRAVNDAPVRASSIRSVGRHSVVSQETIVADEAAEARRQ